MAFASRPLPLRSPRYERPRPVLDLVDLRNRVAFGAAELLPALESEVNRVCAALAFGCVCANPDDAYNRGALIYADAHRWCSPIERGEPWIPLGRDPSVTWAGSAWVLQQLKDDPEAR